MQTTPRYNKFLILLPYVLIFVVIFLMNFLQLPMTDEWVFWSSDKGIDVAIHSIVKSYMTWNARIGELFYKLFATMGYEDIFVMQKIFGVINTVVFIILLFNVFFIVVGRYPNFKDTKDSAIFLFTYLFINLASDFNDSFIWSVGAANYGWALCFYSCIAVPYRKFFDYTFKSKKEITIFNLTLQYEEGYFSIKEIVKGILFLIISVLTGMGAEATTPIILIGLAMYTLYLVFIKKVIPPLWFFMGGVGLFVGWLLLYFSPGQANRNEGDKNYIPITEQSIVTILQRFIRYCCYDRPQIYLNWIVMGILLIVNKKDNNNLSLFFKGCLILFFCGVGLVSLLYAIPARTYITFTIFLVIANLVLLSLVVQKYTKQFFVLGLLIFISLSSFELIEYHRFNTLLNGYFSYIVEQRDAGVKDIKIYTKMRKQNIIRYGNLYTKWWVQVPMARYFGVDNVEFFDKDTGKSYRRENS